MAKLHLLLVMLPIVATIEVREIKNPILPVSLGPAYISNSRHIFSYHINISNIDLCLVQFNTLLLKINDTLANYTNENFAYITYRKLSQTFDFLNFIKENTHLFHKQNKRDKRGLINIVGKANKWLFGTLDSDDEKRYDSYLQLISNNEQVILEKFKNEHTILTKVINAYNSQLVKITDNQKLITTKLESIDKQILDISHVLYLSIILDNIRNELDKVKYLFDNIDNAISFAKVNIMHNSILNANQLNDLIITIQGLYGKDRIVNFKQLINYYSLFSTQVMIKESMVIFSIYTPIINPVIFTLYKIYPIPILNLTIVLPNPYVLLNEVTQWSAANLCPEIEQAFVCKQDILSKEEMCIRELLISAKNECPVTSVHYKETSVEKLHGEEILVIPAGKTIIKTTCRPHNIFSIDKPSLIELPNCPLEIEGKLYEKERKSDLQYILEIPNIQLNVEDNKEKQHMEIQQVNYEEIKNAQIALNNMKFANLRNKPLSQAYWSFLAIPILIILAIVTILWKLKKGLPRKTQENSQKIREPTFSELKEGRVI